MAKCRFPGKALKLNARKRIKFNWDGEKNPDELRVLQIKSGLLLFRHLFGDSEEEDDFSGFVSTNPSKIGKGCSISNFDQQKNGNKGQLSQKAIFKNSAKAVENEGEKEENLLSESLSPLVSPIGGRRSLRGINKGHKLDQLNSEPVIISNAKDDANTDELSVRMILKRKKLLMKESEKAKKFVLPSISAHSSRVIKPNMRIFSDMTTLGCTNSIAVCDKGSETINRFPFPLNPPAKLSNQNIRPDSPEFDERVEKDPVCRSITLYTDAITEQFKGPVARGRKPKKLLRQVETPGQDEVIVAGESLSPIRGAKEEKVKEKIEKLLRSPWDERLKQNTSLLAPTKESEALISSVSKTILRKARLNLNNKTLQKLRSPSSLQQHLISASDTGLKSRKCGLCQMPTFKSVICYGVSCCETCQLTMNCFIEGTFSSLVCQGGQGECQLVGLSPKERCESCWLSKILATCAMPNLLHDNLRKQLPSIIREKVPTSLGRSFNVNSISLPQRDVNDIERGRHFSGEDLSCSTFGSLIDLPGGWKRKCGNEVVVISPSGEKFRSLSKLEEYLNCQGIKAEAAVLFGTLKQIKNDFLEDPKHKSKFYKKSKIKSNNVVITTLPGGWSRRFKWRHSGDKFDTYVCSPDGRIFRTRKDLGAYFQRIGKVDDMNKYFPVISSSHSYSENSEASTTEPFSEASSEVNTEKSAVESESDKEITESRAPNKLNDDLVISQPKISRSRTAFSEESNLSSSVIISNFTNSILLNSPNVVVDGSEDNSFNNVHVNLGKDDANSVSSIDGSYHGDSSAIDLNFLSDEKINEGFGFKFKTFEEFDSEKINISIPNTFSSSDMLDIFKDRSKHKHKKHKKKKKKHHSSSRKHESDNDSNKHFHKNKGVTDYEIAPHHLRKNYKSDHVGLKHLHKKCELGTESIKTNYNKVQIEITNDGLSLGTSERQEALNNCVKLAGADEFILSEASNANIRSETKGNLNDFNSISFVDGINTSVPSSSINIATIFSDKDLQTPPVHHPNDTWSTLVNSSVDNTLQPSLHVASNEIMDGSELAKKSTTLSTENEATLQMQANLKLKIKTRGKMLKSNFTKEQFGNGWHRKIKWNNDGQGKVAFLTSPEGQKIISSIELLAYFKKSGRPFPNLDIYFPPNLVKKELTNDNLQDLSASVEGEAMDKMNDVAGVENSFEPPKFRGIKNKLVGKLERGRGRKVLYRLPRSKFGKKALKHLNSTLYPNGSLNMAEKEHNFNKNRDGLEDTAVQVDGGPRVKHVCRSQAQVLGMPRAVFPSPDGKSTSKKIVFSERKQKQYLAVITPKGKRILRKTIWCHKCPGCTTPNCEICSNCLDMKKYGGPGTKKKPCIMRKCENPFKAIKVSVAKENLSSLEGEISERETGEKNETSSKKGDSDVLSIKLSSLQTSDSDLIEDVGTTDFSRSRYQDENFKSAEKSIFIPKPFNRHINEVKDRADSLQGKEFIPGARVNIDYWQDYDAEEMLINGFPIITSLPLDIESLCFRCGSGGLEEMLYCIWCCEGVHPFCLEEGEGPESDEQETLWVCKKCTVCHVCGAPNDLMQCSDCRRHFHIECLGPLSHISCHTTSDGSWKTEAMKLLSFSMPKQAPLIDVGAHELNLASIDEVSAYLYENMERFEDEMVLRPRTYYLPSSWQHPELFPSLENKPRKKDVFIESVFIEDTPENLEEEGGFCLEDEFEGFSDLLPFVDVGMKENTIDVFTGIDLYPDFVPSEREEEIKNRIGMDVEEYLALGYSKINPFSECHTDFSWYKLLRMIHFELFTVLNYPTWKQMRKKGQVTEASWKVHKRKFNSVKKNEIDSSIDLKSVLEIRRAEVQLDIKEREEIRLMEERRIRDIERENARHRRLLLEKEKTVKHDNDRTKLTCTEESPPGEFLQYEEFDEMDEEGGTQWQPHTWEEFDSLFRPSHDSPDSCEREPINGNTSIILEYDIGEDVLPTCSYEEEIIKDSKVELTDVTSVMEVVKKRKLSNESMEMKKLKLVKCSVKVPKIDILDKSTDARYNLNRPLLKVSKTVQRPKLIKTNVEELSNMVTVTNHELEEIVVVVDKNPKESFHSERNRLNLPEPLSELNNSEIKEDNIDEFVKDNFARDKGSVINHENLIEKTSLSSKAIRKKHSKEVDYTSLLNCDFKKEIKIKGYDVDMENCTLGNVEHRRSSRASHGRASELASLRKALLDM